MRSMRPWRLLAGLAAALAAGCATLEAPFDEHLASEVAPVRDCAQWYARLDAEVDAAGVRDVEEARVAGFPYLRVNRAFAALRDRAARSPAAGDSYADRLAALDLEARRFEIANLPRERLAGLPGMEGQAWQAAWTRTHDCARLLRKIDFAQTERRALALERATVPDDYSLAMRTLGLYPITRLAFARGVRNWQDMLARNEVIFGATAPGTAGGVDTLMLRNLFGVKVKQVQGYAGSAAKRLAVENGEIDGDCGGWTSVPEDWLRERKINVMIRLSPTLVAGMDKAVPFGGDLVKNASERKVYDFLTAPERLGRLFMVSGKVPQDRVAALRTGFDAMVADPAFLSEADKLKLLVTPMTGDQVARDVANLYAAPADLVAKAKAIAAE